jgi:DNA-binding NarL/FixJ family response regulator
MAEPRRQTERTRVLIVEDHPILRGVVRLACEHSEDLLVDGEAADGASALEACRQLDPDVMVLDPALPGEPSALELVRTLHEEGSRTRVLVLTGRSDDGSVFASVRAGVDGYLDRSAGSGAIASAISRVAAGERVFSPEHERVAVRELGRLAKRVREVTGVRAAITDRELEILEYLSVGLTVKQVAGRLGLSPRTVETHIAKLYRKLGVRNRVQAISRAASLGLIRIG